MPEPKTSNRGFVGAYRKGFAAARDGQSADACPYKPQPGETRAMGQFTLTWRRHWMNGWMDFHKEAEDARG